METYKTPGVYVREIPTLPTSVAAVETAIPAFIGYTQFASYRGDNLEDKAVRISSLLDYELRFGSGPNIAVDSVSLDANNNVVSSKVNSTFYLYDSLRLFYANGGGDCFIISIGNYEKKTINVADLIRGLTNTLIKADAPTLVVFPDGIALSKSDLFGLYKSALEQCNNLKDRFLIMDVHLTDPFYETVDFTNDIDTFRNAIGNSYLNYGAAYYPYLQTNLERAVKYRDIKGKVNKLGTIVDWSNFIAVGDTNTLNLLDSLNKIVTDLTINLEPSFNTFIANKQSANATVKISTLEDVYLVLENRFQSLLNSPTATIAEIRTAFTAILDYIYEISDIFVDNYAATTTPLTNIEILTTIRTIASSFAVTSSDTKNSPTLHTLGIIDNLASSAEKKIFGAPTNFPRYSLAPRSWAYNSYVTIFSAANNDFTSIEPLLPYPTTTTDEQRKSNMGSVGPVLKSLFYLIYSGITRIYDEAKGMEQQKNDSLLLQVPVLKNVIEKLKKGHFFLPPSGAIAGIYASVDANRGVFKSPANVSVNAVIKPTVTISTNDNDRLNVDIDGGKSINVIRAFPGKGILVWGARTLAGNDNEWRYVSVRRFFIFAEESIKKAIEQFVFEPNVQDTWIKVKGAIEHFLTDQWKAGALAGTTPQQAFFVSVGLGQTMTAQDILEGRMIVEVGMAASRPAEFIILKFSHKLQEA